MDPVVLTIEPGSVEEAWFLKGNDQWQKLIAKRSATEVIFHRNEFVPRQNHAAEFANYLFRVPVVFDECRFQGSWKFVNCEFQSSVAMKRVNVSGSLGFDNCAFHDSTNLDCTCAGGVRISGNRAFGRIAFDDDCEFASLTVEGNGFARGVRIGAVSKLGTLNIEACTFGGGFEIAQLETVGEIKARKAEFRDCARFRAVRCAGDADFSGAKFHKDATFASARFGGTFSFRNAKCTEGNFSGTQFEGTADFRGDPEASISSASFQRSQFLGEARFDDRQFDGPVSFHEAEFSKAPSFFNVQLHDNYDFATTRFLDTKSDISEGTYRVLKKLMHEKQAYSDELQFFVLELKARGRKIGGIEGFLIKAYSLVSDCGRSIWRPLACATGSLTLALVLNALVVGGVSECLFGGLRVGSCEYSSKTMSALVTLTKAQAMPFLATSKDEYSIALVTLGVKHSIPLCLHVVGFATFVLVAASLFLSLLGIRNLVRMKAA